jgi:hypothetical protein
MRRYALRVLRSVKDHGEFIEHVLEPMASKLGLNYYLSALDPPSSDTELAFEALRCGEQLLHAFTYPGEWPTEGFMNGLSGREARKAAKYLIRVLTSDSGRDAVSVMAEQYGQVMAATWRDAADEAEDDQSADRLRLQATLSHRLASLAATVWPVDGYQAVRQSAAEAKPISYEIGNPDALVNLALDARRMRAYADALAVAMWNRFDDFERAILLPVWDFSPPYAMVTTASWAFVGKFWTNLLRDSPLSTSEVRQRAREEASM